MTLLFQEQVSYDRYIYIESVYRHTTMNHTYIIAFWSLSPISSCSFCMDYFMSALRKYGDIQCLNCKDKKDRRTRKLLNQADLVVIVLRQNRREINNLFCKSAWHFSNCIYLIANYFPDQDFNLKKISFELRIPSSRLVCIPYSPRYGEVLRTREVKHAGEMMLKALGF